MASSQISSALTLSQALGVKDAGKQVLQLVITTPPPFPTVLSTDLNRFTSKELTPTFSRDEFLKPTKKDHIWHRKVRIKVRGKRGLTANLYIDPSIGDEERKTVLRVKAGLKSKLQARLDECGEDSWLYVETEVTDGSGRGYGRSDFSPHPVKEGSCSFYQELVRCEEMRGCRSNEVMVRIKVTLVTTERHDYTLSDGEDGYVLVSHKS